MELDLLEALALSTDRPAALAALLPGTALHDYWRGVHLQHEGRLDEVDTLIEEWKARHPSDDEPLARLQRRQLLLRAGSDLAAHADAIRFEAGLSFDDQAEAQVAAQRYPTRLDPALLDPEALARDALGRATDLSHFTDWLLTNLVPDAAELDPPRRRDLLKRLPRANIPGVVELVALELDDPASRGLGALPITPLLTLEQLHQLANLRPALRQEPAWVQAMLLRLAPSAQIDSRTDLGARRAYLDALWSFVEPLSPSFNGLKAQVLHHRLDLDSRLGTFDRARFLRYLDLPRSTSYVNPAWLRSFPPDQLVNPSPVSAPGLGALGDDEALVREHLHHFLATEGADAFADRLRRDWLDMELATARLLAGDPDTRRWIGMLPESVASALRERVDIELSPRNPPRWGAADPVSLEVIVKNVPELVIKVFRINALAYFLARGEEIDTSLDLDGMAASDERTIRLDAAPIQRTRLSIDLPGCARAGTYVVELIGNGKSSRALIRKGALRHTSRVGAAGVAIRVFDEAGRAVQGARVWTGGREHVAADDGEVRIPFSTQPGSRPMLLVHGDLAQRETLNHPAEQYNLWAGIHLERQALVAGKTARIVLRPMLTVGSSPAPVALLEEPRVEITVSDLSNVSSTKSEQVTLRDDAETVVEFRVPEDAAHIAVILRGRVRVASTQRTIDHEHGARSTINRLHVGPETELLHLATSETGHVLHLLGKCGEPRPGRAVSLSVKHAAVDFEVATTLSTDERGRIELGHLPGVERVTAGNETWNLWPDARLPPAFAAEAGATITLPAPPFLAPHELAFAVSLSEIRGRVAVRDCTDRVRLDGRALVIGGLDAGQYALACRGLAAPILLEIAPAAVDPASGWSTSGQVMTELTPPLPLIRSMSVEAEEIVARISDAGPDTRVHLVATVFRPSSALLVTLDRETRPPRTNAVAPVLSHYISGRDIGDEHRYILERRTAARRPGVLLDKPSLLLNPWALRSTSTEIQVAAAGGAYGASPPRMQAPAPAAMRPPSGKSAARETLASYDFLAAPAVVIANLRPDAQGVLRVPRAALGSAQLARWMVVDSASTSTADLPLPEIAPAHRDRSLRLALDAEGHFAEERRVEPLPAGASIVVDDVRTGKLELVDTLSRAHQVLLASRDDAALREFSFVTRWPSLDAAEQQKKYSQYACHELNLFLYVKDPPFFERVIRPYLANRLHKTFVDRWLLGEDLTAYLEPWAFGRLNTLEQVLLARRVPRIRDSIARLIADEVHRIPPDPERDAQLVDTLLGAAGLEGRDVTTAQAFLVEPEPMEETRGGGGGLAKRRGPRREDGSTGEGASLESLSRAAPAAMPAGLGGAGRAARDLVDLREREASPALYRGADKTQEWAETSYWKEPIADITPDLLEPNRFLLDLALHREGPFLSPHLGECARSFTSALTCLAFLDLPFSAAAHEITIDDTRLTLAARSHALAARTRIAAIAAPEARGPILVGQGYVRADDALTWDGAEQREKWVTSELLTGVVYECRVAVTNPTSAAQRLDVLLQIPRGAVPVQSGFLTRTRHLRLGAYGTQALTYSFYFPAPGRFSHFPAHVIRNGELAAFAAPATLEVVREPSSADTGSWAHVSQHGSTDEVLAHLGRENLGRIDLDRVAWRMRDEDAFTRITALLAERHVYHDKLWAYGLFHAAATRRGPIDTFAARAAEWLRHQDWFLEEAGPALEGALVTIDPVERASYQHLEYAPLINARAHQLGKRRVILNDALAAQYRSFLDVVAHRARIDDADLLAAAHYAFCLDRVDDAIDRLDRVDPERLATRLQYDYLSAYAACCRGDLGAARRLASPWLDHPVDRWRLRFAALAAMLDEAEGRRAGPAGAADPDSRDQAMTDLASRQPTLDLAVEQGQIVLQHRNLDRCQLRFYRMDIELLFSRQPFVQGDVERFSWIDPGEVIEQALGEGGRTRVPIPASMRGQNLVVDAVAAGLRRSIVHYAHDLAVELAHHYGQVRVLRASTQAPLPAAYVKAYARRSGGEVAFFKDGYTDLRGRFDYATLSTDDLDRVERFAILVVSGDAGSTVLEAAPPAR